MAESAPCTCGGHEHLPDVYESTSCAFCQRDWPPDERYAEIVIINDPTPRPPTDDPADREAVLRWWAEHGRGAQIVSKLLDPSKWGMHAGDVAKRCRDAHSVRGVIS